MVFMMDSKAMQATMLHFMTHSNWLPGYPDIWPKTASGQICTGGSGWHYAGTRNLREAGFSVTVGKTHPVCWKSPSNASLVRNNNPLDLTNVFKRAHPLSWAHRISSPGSVGLLHYHVNQFQTVCLLPLSSSLSISLSSPCPAPSTHTHQLRFFTKSSDIQSRSFVSHFSEGFKRIPVSHHYYNYCRSELFLTCEFCCP